MPVIEAQRASILVPHDHRHISQKRMLCLVSQQHPGDLSIRQVGFIVFGRVINVSWPAADEYYVGNIFSDEVAETAGPSPIILMHLRYSRAYGICY